MPKNELQKINLEDRQGVMDKYKECKDKGQIRFITFHQSYSYEEFVEGIKPVLDESCNELRYEKKSGILKQITNLAETEYLPLKTQKEFDFNSEKNDVLKISLGDSTKEGDWQIYDYCIKNNKIALGWGGSIDFSSAQNEEDLKNIFNEHKTELEDPSPWTVSAMKMFKFWIKKDDLIFVSKGNKFVRAIGRVLDDEYIYNPDTEIPYCQFRNVAWLLKDVEIPIEKLYERNLSPQSIYMMFKEKVNFENLNELIGKKTNKPIKNYVLIIDEINRGNISKIFGELITLLEDDKRLYQENELTVNLPYSENEKEFGLPPNLYFIGTMNTSDRSIASIDIALRRRFKFKEITPDSKHVPDDIAGLNADFRAIFEKMNQKICILLDREHQIGHSYFMQVKNVDDLKEVWFNCIIPLLNEYFYCEWEKLKEIAPTFIMEDKTSKIIKNSDVVDEVFYDFYKPTDFENGNYMTFEEAIIGLYENKEVKELAGAAVE